MLVEVETVLGSLPTVKREPISATECRKLQVYTHAALVAAMYIRGRVDL